MATSRKRKTRKCRKNQITDEDIQIFIDTLDDNVGNFTDSEIYDKEDPLNNESNSYVEAIDDVDEETTKNEDTENIRSIDPPPVRKPVLPDLNAALDENNYDSLPEQEDVTCSYISTDKTVKYQWKWKYELVGRRGRENIIYNKPGPSCNQCQPAKSN